MTVFSLPAAKIGYIRNVDNIAVVGNRQMGRFAGNHWTFKVSSGQIGSNSELLGGQFPGQGVNLGFTLTSLQIYLGLF